MEDLKAEIGQSEDGLDVMKEIQKYVKLESNKSATVKLVDKLIKFSSEKNLCFLCKRGVNADELAKMKSLFSVESFDVKDDKIEAQKKKVEKAINSQG